jgi:hypothetical protein
MCPQMVLTFGGVSISPAKVCFLGSWAGGAHAHGQGAHAYFLSFSITTGPIPSKLSQYTPSACPQVVLTFWRVSISIAKVWFLGHGQGVPIMGTLPMRILLRSRQPLGRFA